MQQLSLADLLRKAPVIFTGNYHKSLSKKYTFVPTIDVVNEMGKIGWFPVDARQATSTVKAGYQKHVLRFRQSGDLGKTLTVGDNCIEAVMVNSHDGSTCYQMHAGVFRLACSNGLLVAESRFPAIKFRHKTVTTDDVVKASLDIVKSLPNITGVIDKMKSKQLTSQEKGYFALDVLKVKYPKLPNIPITSGDLLKPRRIEDEKSDLWTVFNVVQENCLRGGLLGKTAKGKAIKTRNIVSIQEDIRLNTQIWELAERRI